MTSNISLPLSKKQQVLFFVLFLAIIFSLSLFSSFNKSITYDEPNHQRYGIKILNLNSDRIGLCQDGTMPVSALNAIPAFVSSQMQPGPWKEFLGKMETGRYASILMTLLLAFFVFQWSKSLYGTLPAFFSLFLFTFSPNIIAHSRLMTTEIPGTLMITAALYYFWKFMNDKSIGKAFVSASVLGISLLTKYTCVLLFPIFLIIFIVNHSNELMMTMRRKDLKKAARGCFAFFKYSLIFIIASIVILNIGFLFNRTFTPLEEYEFRSRPYKNMQAKLDFMKRVPVPIPYPILYGLDWHTFREQTGEAYGNFYLLGEIQDGKPFRNYFFIGFLYKVPLAVQFFLLLSLILYIFKRKFRTFRENETFLLIPLVFFAMYFNYFFRMQIGFRHMLVVFPLIHVFCGSLATFFADYGNKFKAMVGLLSLYLAVSTLSYFPHFLSYFNELVWDRKMAYKIMSDSNLDWGQNLRYLEKYLENNPDVILEPEEPIAARVIVPVRELTGIFDEEKYRWLRENFEPDDHVAYTYLLYDLRPSGD